MMKKTDEAGLMAIRQQLVTGATGDVLEIGAGTGQNIGLYGPAVSSLTLTEPSEPMLKRLQSHVAQERPATVVLRAPAEDLPFSDDSFDTVVSTLVFCGVDDQPRALREARRVLRPGGKLIFIEHVRSDDAKAAKGQDHMNWLNRLVVCCDCNRPTLSTIKSAGFEVSTISHGELPKSPKFVRPMIYGSATAPSAA
jgi:ubiquinone/menaquinone biosynthesis C-methylase UbiE